MPESRQFAIDAAASIWAPDFAPSRLISTTDPRWGDLLRGFGNAGDADGVAKTEADHFGNCPVGGALVDMRDLAQILAHVHDAEIEISEGPELPRKGPAARISRNEMVA